METWKEFEQNVITHSAAHHLMAISELLHKHGYARVSDVARRLKITRGSASITLKALRERGLVQEDENKFLLLSERGRVLVQTIQSKRLVLIRFFRDILGVEAETAEVDACKVEHLISHETGEKLLAFVQYLFSKKKTSPNLLSEFRNYQLDCGDTDACPYCIDECLLKEIELDQAQGPRVLQITRDSSSKANDD